MISAFSMLCSWQEGAEEGRTGGSDCDIIVKRIGRGGCST